MFSKSEILKITAIIGLLVSLGSLSAGVSLEAGTISETEVTRSIISERWTGISGEVYRGNETLENHYIGDLSFNSSQGGSVLTTEVEGIKNGGYYLAFLPENLDINPDQLSSINESDLEENDLFSKDRYPSFYPNYTQYYDNPRHTFEKSASIQVDGENYQAFQANLSGNADTFLLKYDKGEENLPIIFSPIDGQNRGSTYQSCYVENCNFQTLLPKLGNSTYSYSTYIFSRGESVSACGEITADSTAILMNDLEGAENCLEFEGAEDVHLDFYNSKVENSTGCGLSVNSSEMSVTDLTVQNHNKGICVQDSNFSILGGSIYQSNQGIEAGNSEVALKDVNLAQNSLDTNFRTSNVTANNLTLGTTSINLEGKSIGINSVQSSLSRPPQAGEDQLSLDIQFEILERAGNPAVNSLGVKYPTNVSSEFEDMYLYKYEGSSSPYEITRLGPLARRTGVAWYNDTIESFSSFELYGVEAVQDDGEGEDSDSEDSSGGGGTGSGFSSGSTGGGITDYDPTTEIPEANLSISPSEYEALRGETISVGFEADNTGNVSLENLQVDLTNSTLASVPREFQSLNIGEVRQGRILVTVPEDKQPRNMTLQAGIQFRNLTLDTEEFDLNISETTQEKTLNIAEAPSFVSLRPNETRSIGFYIENPTNQDINGVEAEIRGGGECVSLGNQTFDFSSGDQKNIQPEFYTTDQERVCNSVVVFSHEEDILGYNPMRIEVEDEDEEDIEIPYYIIITVLWSSVLAYRVIKNGRRE